MESSIEEENTGEHKGVVAGNNSARVPVSERESVVNVEEAQQVFEEMQQHAEEVVQEEIRSSMGSPRDVEMAVPANGTDFDIQTFFEDSVRRGQEVGHTPKRMGVVVNNLTVVGMGSDATSIPDNLDILKALWPLNWYTSSDFVKLVKL
jgi:hypothetical protein